MTVITTYNVLGSNRVLDTDLPHIHREYDVPEQGMCTITLTEEAALKYSVERTRLDLVLAGIETGSDRLKQRVPASELSDDQMAELLALFDAWEDIAEGATIEEGTHLTYQEDALYRCISEHDKQATWAPPTAVSLFVSETPTGVIPAWSQPGGSTDAYGMGFIVEHNGSFWESTNDANVWEPPTEWTEIDDPTA